MSGFPEWTHSAYHNQWLDSSDQIENPKLSENKFYKLGLAYCIDMDPIKDILGVHAIATRAAHSNIDKLLQQESRDSTESDKLNEIQARFDRGGFLIFLDCPRGLQFGFDLNQWTVDTQFMGLKMIPTGIWHFMSV